MPRPRSPGANTDPAAPAGWYELVSDTNEEPIMKATPEVQLIVGGVPVRGFPATAEEFEEATGERVTGDRWRFLRNACISGFSAGNGYGGWFRCRAEAVQGELIVTTTP